MPHTLTNPSFNEDTLLKQVQVEMVATMLQKPDYSSVFLLVVEMENVASWLSSTYTQL